MQQSIIKSFKDLFSGMVLAFVAKVTMLSLLLTVLIVWLIGDSLNSMLASYLSFIPWEWLANSGVAIAKVLIAYSVFLAINAILTSVMMEPLIIKLASKHYPNLKVVGSPDIKKSVWLSIKSALIFFGLFLVSFPLTFVPFLGAVWMLWLWSILIKEPTIYDINSLFKLQDEKSLVTSKQSTIIAMIASGFNYIPVLNILSPIFAQIIFLHYIAKR
jgi:hypothetical protein